MSGGIKHIRSLAQNPANRIDKTSMPIVRKTITTEAFNALKIAEIPQTFSPVPANGLGKLLKAIF